MVPHPQSRRALLEGVGTTVAAVTGVTTAVSSAGCLTSGAGGPKTVAMTDDLRFDPRQVSVASGQSVTWETTGDVGHTVTAYEAELPEDATYFASGGFESESAARNDVSGGIVDTGETFTVTFDTPGTYEYFCIPHEGSGMVGSVQVTED